MAALPLLEAIRTGTDPVIPEVDGRRNIGGYPLGTIDREKKTVSVGCHTVTFDEMERLAQKHSINPSIASYPWPILADYLEDNGADGAELAELREPVAS